MNPFWRAYFSIFLPSSSGCGAGRCSCVPWYNPSRASITSQRNGDGSRWDGNRLPPWRAQTEEWKEWPPRKKSWVAVTWQFCVTFLGWLSDPFKWLSDLQLGDEKVTLNHLGRLILFFFGGGGRQQMNFTVLGRRFVFIGYIFAWWRFNIFFTQADELKKMYGRTCVFYWWYFWTGDWYIIPYNNITVLSCFLLSTMFLSFSIPSSNWPLCFFSRWSGDVCCRCLGETFANLQLTCIIWPLFFHEGFDVLRSESRWRFPLPKGGEFVRGHDRPRPMGVAPSTFQVVYLN